MVLVGYNDCWAVSVSTDKYIRKPTVYFFGDIDRHSEKNIQPFQKSTILKENIVFLYLFLILELDIWI